MFDQKTTIVYATVPPTIITAPIRYLNNGVTQSYCPDDIDYTDGQILFSGSIYTSQESCKPNTGNAGNYYSWPAATAGGYHETNGFNEPNSVCPKGWQMTVNTEAEVKSWHYLIRNTYSISDNNDSKIRLLPMSFIRSGNYGQGSLKNRASYGLYWSSTALSSTGAYGQDFGGYELFPQYSNDKNRGFSVRCVSR